MPSIVRLSVCETRRLGCGSYAPQNFPSFNKCDNSVLRALFCDGAPSCGPTPAAPAILGRVENGDLLWPQGFLGRNGHPFHHSS
jgi:hypothetical protein